MLVSVNNPQYRKSMNSSICPSKGNAEVPNSRHKISYMAKVRQEDISQCFRRERIFIYIFFAKIMLICQNITFLIFKQAKVAFVLEKKGFQV